MKVQSDDIWRRATAQGLRMQPLLTPLEAAMTPAKERRAYGALRHAKESFYPNTPLDGDSPRRRQRQKIWVR